MENNLQTKENTTPTVQDQPSQMDIAIKQMNEITQFVVENIKDDRDKADELYDFFKDEIDISGDKNPATREGMAQAIGHKLKGTDQMIELLKVKAKLINPQKGFSVNVNLGKFDDNKGGNTSNMIDLVESINFEINNDDD
jgi:hypothetical protein